MGSFDLQQDHPTAFINSNTSINLRYYHLHVCDTTRRAKHHSAILEFQMIRSLITEAIYPAKKKRRPKNNT